MVHRTHSPVARKSLLAVFAVCLLTAWSVPSVWAAGGPQDPPNEAAVLHYQTKYKVSRDEAVKRLKAQLRAHDIVDEALHALGEDYAGVWFDNGDGRFKIGIPRGTPPAEARALADRLEVGADTDTPTVDHRWSDLESSLESVTTDLSPLLRDRVVSIGIDTSINAVAVGVSEAATEEERRRIDRAANEADVRVAVSDEPASVFEAAPAACSFPYCDRPLRGGVKIFPESFRWCTAGFYAQRWGVPFIMTAGHCARDNRVWSSKYASTLTTRSIGLPERWYYGNDNLGDAGLISAAGSYWDVGWQPIIAAWGWNNLGYPIRGRAWNYVGETICHMGVTTTQRCGSVQQIHLNHTYTDGVTVHQMVRTDACGQGGDSGGPVVGPTNIAKGIWSGGVECPSTFGLFEEVQNAEWYLGVYVHVER